MTRDVVEHSITTADGPLPVLAWHLLLCEVGLGHLDKSMSDVFNETVGALSFGRVCDDLGFVVVYPSEAFVPDEFATKVGIESARGGAYVYT